MKNFRIVFMGTPDFAVSTLGSLLINGYNVVGVVTTPDKPSGRGRKMSKSAVKKYAEYSSLDNILQPENLKDAEFISRLTQLNPDLFIVVAFRMLPEVVWKIPSIGTINLHASLLPDYRGAAPINHAIINGESTTGVTTFFIDEKIDTGKILLREEVQIFPFENAGDLHDKLMKLGARLVIKTLSYIENKVQAFPQTHFIDPEKSLKPAPKIHPADCYIDWKNEPAKIHNFIRGLSPSPGARSVLKSNSAKYTFKIFESQPEFLDHDLKPGTILTDGKHFMKVACTHGFINIINLQIEGKTRMNVVEFLRGFEITDYIIEVS